MSKTLLYLQEKKIDSADELRERAAAATERYHTLGDSIKAAEKRMGEIAVLRAHIVNYAKTRDAYAAYRKAGYSKKFLEAHREEIELHKAAKAAFDEADLKKVAQGKRFERRIFRTALPKESSVSGVSQSQRRNAGTGSRTEKCGTVLCRRKADARNRTGALMLDCRS